MSDSDMTFGEHVRIAASGEPAAPSLAVPAGLSATGQASSLLLEEGRDELRQMPASRRDSLRRRMLALVDMVSLFGAYAVVATVGNGRMSDSVVLLGTLPLWI